MDLNQTFNESCKRWGISQSTAAKAMSISAATLSQWASGNYAGDNKRIDTLVSQWMRREEVRRTTKAIPIVDTANFMRITNAITIAHQELDIALITGPAGSGKTTALRVYLEKNQGSAIYIEADASMNKVSLMRHLAVELGVDEKGEFTSLVRRVVESLTGRDMVVLIDQADYLSENSLELLWQTVFEKGGAGLVLVGLDRLAYTIRSAKGDHQQLVSRIGVNLSLVALRDSDATKIVLAVWPELDKDTITAFIKQAEGSGRRLQKLIKRSHLTALTNRMEVPDQDIVATASDMIMKKGSAA